jgi:tetratricopeptide (TPR) repeat protein
MPAIFISHSSLDQPVADELKASLAKLGFEQIFLDFDKDSGIGAGENWEKRLYEELARCHAVILVLTPNWLTSTWCRVELAQARALGKVILPVICAQLGERFVLPEVQAVDLMDWHKGGIERLEQRLNAITNELARGFRLDPSRPPYPGIHAFEAEDAAIYFGRDDETRAVIERLDARRTQGGARLVAVIGASGSGKSSLLRAGVLPQLGRRRREWIALPPIRPEKAPLETVAKALAEHTGKPETWRVWREQLGKPDAAGYIEELLKDLRIGESRAATVLLPIDQFEEVFTVAVAAERTAFMQLLAAALDPARDLPLMVIATGRSDVLEGLIQAGNLAHLTETFPLPLMPLERVPRLVEGPAAIAALNVEKGLSERIARDVESAEALPLLAHTLWLLHRRGAAEKKLTLAEYEALGDPQRGLNPIQNSVRLAADQAIGGLRPTEQELAALRDAFVPHLVRIRLEDGKRVRQGARMAELPPESLRLIRALVQARLLTTRALDAGASGGSERDSLIEVAHEALFKAWPTLDEWLIQEQAFLTDLERIRGAHDIWTQASAEQKPNALLQGLLLARARDWMVRYPQRFLGRDMEPLRAFIAESAAADDAARERAASELARTRRMERMLFRGAIAATVVMAILAAGAGVAAWFAVKSEQRATRNFELTIDQADALVAKTSTELKDRIGISQDAIRRMLGLIESQMDKLAKVDERSPRLATSRANMLSAFVESYVDLGELQEARQRAEQCVAIARPLQGARDQTFDITRVLGRCLERLAGALAARSSFNDAIPVYRESIALRRRVLAADPGNAELQVELCHILAYYSFALLIVNNVDEGFDRAQESLAISRSLVARDRQNSVWLREYVDSLNMYGMLLDAKGGTGNAIKAYQEAIELAAELVRKDSGNATLQRFLSNILANLSDTLIQHAFNDEALTALNQSIAVKRRLNTADPGNTTWDYELSVSLNKLGATQLALNRFLEAAESLTEGRDRLRSMLERDPKNGLRRWALVEGLWIMAIVRIRQGDRSAARAHAQEGLSAIAAVDLDNAAEDMAPRMNNLKKQFEELLASTPLQ